VAAISEQALSRYFEFRGALEAVGVLRREIGLPRTLRTLMALEYRHLRGEPWAGLPEAGTEKERISRRQMGQVVILYRLLKEQIGPSRALEVARKVVKSSAIEFLSHVLPALHRKDYEGLSAEDRAAKAAELSQRIANAEADVEVVGLERVDFTVRKCWFVELSRQAEAPELAGLFCAGDEGFFETRQPEIRFTRTLTLAQNQGCCDMKLHWIEGVSPHADHP